MADIDAFNLLYGNLYVKKDELPGYIAETAIPETKGNNTGKLAEVQSKVDKFIQTAQPLNNREEKPKADTVATIQNSKIIPIENKELITSWDTLTDLINNCTKCRLCNSRKNYVIERGNREADWMFIGEAPGENEDIQGVPFVGAAGQLLDKMLAACKLDKNQDVYICNTVKCRPPQNRNPELDEISACNNYLLSQIKLVKPKLIVILGRIAAHTLLKTTQATSKLRGQVHYLEDNIPVIVTYHPAYLLRNPAAKKDAWEDLQLAMQTFASV